MEEAAFQGEKWHHEFGYSVSVDGNLAIIGARSDDQFNSDSGAASVYRWDGTNWQEQYKIGATNGAEFDYFGTSIALSGENALIGAPFNDQHGHHSGSAYLYDLSATPVIWLPILIK